NYRDVLIVSSRSQYPELLSVLTTTACTPTLEQRKHFAALAFDVTSHYDSAIFAYFNTPATIPAFKKSFGEGRHLRYGENPHQRGTYYGDLEGLFDQLNGKELSYNNLVDVDAAV